VGATQVRPMSRQRCHGPNSNMARWTLKDRVNVVNKLSPRPASAPKNCSHPYHAVLLYVTRDRIGEWYCRVSGRARYSFFSTLTSCLSALGHSVVGVVLNFQIPSKPTIWERMEAELSSKSVSCPDPKGEFICSRSL
jgi:hypothetical protein